MAFSCQDKSKRHSLSRAPIICHFFYIYSFLVLYSLEVGSQSAMYMITFPVAIRRSVIPIMKNLSYQLFFNAHTVQSPTAPCFSAITACGILQHSAPHSGQCTSFQPGCPFGTFCFSGMQYHPPRSVSVFGRIFQLILFLLWFADFSDNNGQLRFCFAVYFNRRYPQHFFMCTPFSISVYMPVCLTDMRTFCCPVSSPSRMHAVLMVSLYLSCVPDADIPFSHRRSL